MALAEPIEDTVAVSVSGRARGRLSGVVASLTAANVLGAGSGFITGPLLARALGVSGRGDLAAVVVPLTLAQGVLFLGIPGFAFRELPRGRPLGEVIGSLGPPLLVIGLLIGAGAVPFADALAGGRPTVRTFLIVVFLSAPLLGVASLLYSCLAALERWRLVVAANLIPFGVAFVSIACLYAIGHLTVATAAAATIAGALLSLLPGLPMLLAGRPVFRISIARGAVSFGVKSWLGGLARTANGRLDQFLMITVVAPRVLGLYAVAATIAGASSLAAGALSPPLMARIAAGETHLISLAVRILLAATVGLNLILALATPVLLSLLFGPQFRGALPMALVLLVAQVPNAGAEVLSAALQADGAPLIPSIGEGIALVITIAGLAVLLRPFGGVGAAFVSLAAYAASFLFQLLMARRRTGIPLGDFLMPARDDFRWAVGRVTDVTSRLRRP